MRVNQMVLEEAVELVSAALETGGLEAIIDHELLHPGLRGAVEGAAGDVDGYDNLCRLLGAPVAVILMAQRADEAAGLPASFMSEINLLRAGSITADLNNFDGYRQLFPQVLERYEQEEGQILLDGIRSDIISRFGDLDRVQATTDRFMHVAVERSREIEGVTIEGYGALVAQGEEVVGVDQVLLAAAALCDIVERSGLEASRGLAMLAAGQCEFSGGMAAIHSAVRAVQPGADAATVSSMSERTLAYLHQFSGQLVNDVLQEIGNDWLANNGQAYLENYREQQLLDDEALDGDDDYDYDDEGPSLDAAEGGEDLLLDNDSFRM